MASLSRGLFSPVEDVLTVRCQASGAGRMAQSAAPSAFLLGCPWHGVSLLKFTSWPEMATALPNSNGISQEGGGAGAEG